MKKDKTILKMVFWGFISLAMYLAVFTNQQAVTDFFTRGGFFAIPVIIIALTFSFVHGAFANFFIDAIGFKPVGKKGGH
jgi:uncharacterized integral membrane protein